MILRTTFSGKGDEISPSKSSLGEHFRAADGVIETDTTESEISDFFRCVRRGAPDDFGGAAG